MLNLVLSWLPGAGLRSGSRVPGIRWVLVALSAVIVTGCATKGDLRDVRDEIQALAAQQRQAFNELSGMNLAVQDTLQGQADELFASRGEINRRLQALEQEMTTIKELLRLNQQSLVRIRDYLEAGGASTRGPVRTDTEPGQEMPQQLTPTQPATGAAEESYNAALTQFNRGNLGTAQQAFQLFLQQYPNSPRAPDVRYYLADILVQQGHPEQAIDAFLQIPQFYPTADKVPDTWYRVGVLYVELNKLDDAREYLQKVVTNYPESDAAQLAKAKLAEIG